MAMLYQKSEITAAIRRHEKMFSAVLLCLMIFFIWSWIFNIFSWSAWNVPLGYQGDAWLAYGLIKAYMEGDILPILYKFVPMLNAPFVANWNDYPVTEDFLFAGIGWLGKLIGLWPAVNFMLLLAHLLAGLSFWYVCRELKYKPIYAFAGAIVYAYSHYIMARGLGHVVLSFYWHIPFLLLVISWVYSKELILYKSKKYKLALLMSVLCGLQNPYYTWMFLQFLGFGFLLHVVRKQYAKAVFTFILIATAFGAFLLVNADTIVYNLANESNAVAGGRNLASLEVYAMKIPELFLTPGNHPISSFVKFSHQKYYAPAFVKGEYWSSYLGFASLAGLILLIATSMYRLLQGKLNRVPLHFWFVTWILLYSVIGGLNLFIGVFGLEYFRATNRYSIFILTISLLFLIRYLSKHSPSKMVMPVAILMVFVGLAEELNNRWKHVFPVINPIAVVVNSDKNFAQTVEREMPNSMVFQLPVAGFPEVGPINKMGDYEHFRPFLFTKTLHYSYGTNKGRSDTDWQENVAMLSPSDMARKLESYGFGVVMINRKGYVDSGKSLIDGLIAEGKSVIAENKDLVAIRLRPAISPDPVDLGLLFGPGWSDEEGTHRWSESSHTKISIINNAKYARPYILKFRLSALSPRVVNISIGGVKLSGVKLAVAGEEQQFPATTIMLPPGKSVLIFDTDARPVSPENGDARLLSFQISDFYFQPEETKTRIDNGEAKEKSLLTKLSAGSKSIKIQNKQPDKPDSFPRFGEGWSDDEVTHRWSTLSQAKIIITNNENRTRPYLLEFKLTALTPRIVTVSIASQSLGQVNIKNPGGQIQFSRARIMLPPGENVLSLNTDSYPVRPSNGDYRKLSFKISDLNFVPENN